MDIIKKSLMTRLMLYFLIISVIPVIIVSYIAYLKGSSAIQEQAFDKLEAVMEAKKSRVLRNLHYMVRAIKTIDIDEVYDILKPFHDNTSGNFDINSKEYEELYRKSDKFIRKYMDIFRFKDVFVICADQGRVIYSGERGKELGADLEKGTYKDTGLARLFNEIMEYKAPSIVDYSYYEPTGTVEAFIGVPFFDVNNNIYCVVAVKFNPVVLAEVLQTTEGLGKTEITYLVGEDFKRRSDTRYDKETTVLKMKIDNKSIRNALNDKNGKNIEFNTEGKKIFTVYSDVGIDECKFLKADFDWAIISEIDEWEALRPVVELEYMILNISSFIIIMVIIFAYFIAKGIAEPIRKISGHLVAVGMGDLSIDIIDIKSNNEIGILAGEFSSMIRKFRKQIGEIIDVTDALTTMVTQILATTTQLASSATETSVSIAETTSTIEEMRQTAEMTGQKAKQLSTSARDMEDISLSGRKATDDTIKNIKRIKEQMEIIAGNIVDLSDKSQSIGEIVSAVQDLAEQSAVLAVNASIEAVKAGDAGKGFTVVAGEVRNLAEQSKDAIKQIMAILNDIHKAVSSSVKSARDGSERVDGGVERSLQAGETILALSNIVSETASDAMQIEATAQQQIVGMEQILLAVKNIKYAGLQNMDSAKQLEDAARHLDKLGSKLKEMIKVYKVTGGKEGMRGEK